MMNVKALDGFAAEPFRSASRTFDLPACSPGTPELGFPRRVDLPFKEVVDRLHEWLSDAEEHGSVEVGRSRVLGSPCVTADGDWQAVDVVLRRGRRGRQVPMVLDVVRWSVAPDRTLLELHPLRLVRPTPGYFRAGNQLMDRLIAVAVAERAPAP